MSTPALDRRLVLAARPGRRHLVVAVILATATTTLILAQATLIARAIARVTDGSSYDALRPTLLALLAVVLTRGALTYAGEVSALRAATAVNSELRRRLLAHTLALGPGWLSRSRTGELTTLTTRGLDALDPYFSRYLPQLLLAVLVPVMVLTRVAAADWTSALIIAVTLPLIPVFMVLVGAHTQERTERQWQLLARLGGHFLDVVAGLPTLKLFNRAKAQAEVIRAVTDAHRKRTMVSLRVAFLSALVLELLATLAMALVAVDVGVRLLHGDLPYETALLVLLLTPEAYLPLRSLGAQYHASMEGVAAAQSVFDVLETPLPMVDRPRLAAPRLSHASIRLDDVTVRFEGRGRPSLDHVTFTLEPQEHVLVTGASGSGKSTLLATLLRLVQPAGGRLRVDDLDADDLDVDAWRAQIAWLPQHPHLFAGTVADNIALGAPDTPRDAVRRAATLAGADDFVLAMPDGYDTPLPERGLSLSAGQRQRIALARVLLRSAPLVLLDEPTAHLDDAGVTRLHTVLADELADRTVVWVSHDSRTPLRVDRVVQLDLGRLRTSAAVAAS